MGKARIHTINGFPAHADQTELVDWHSRIGPVEEPAMSALVSRLVAAHLKMPRLHQILRGLVREAERG